MAAFAAQDRSITIHTPPIEFRAGDVHVAPAAVTVEGHEISVNLPEGCIQLEATVQAAQVHVAVPPAQVVVQRTAPERQIHKRDPVSGDLVETLNIFKD